MEIAMATITIDFDKPKAPATRRGVIYRMATAEHVCPFGLKALDLLKRYGFEVDDHLLRTREEIDAFKAQHGVKTTPQIWIEGQRIGGHDDLRQHLGLVVSDPKALTYHAGDRDLWHGRSHGLGCRLGHHEWSIDAPDASHAATVPGLRHRAPCASEAPGRRSLLERLPGL